MFEMPSPPSLPAEPVPIPPDVPQRSCGCADEALFKGIPSITYKTLLFVVELLPLKITLLDPPIPEALLFHY